MNEFRLKILADHLARGNLHCKRFTMSCTDMVNLHLVGGPLEECPSVFPKYWKRDKGFAVLRNKKYRYSTYRSAETFFDLSPALVRLLFTDVVPGYDILWKQGNLMNTSTKSRSPKEVLPYLNEMYLKLLLTKDFLNKRRNRNRLIIAKEIYYFLIAKGDILEGMCRMYPEQREWLSLVVNNIY